jgi:CheY-like chemotaxis protein
MKKYEGLNCVLLIDDDEATNFINKLIIQKSEIDAEIIACKSGQEGLDFLSCQGKYLSSSEYPQPGIIFLDINMPGMNGWEFLENYNKLSEDQKAKIVVAMLTTSFNPDDEEAGKSNQDVKQFMHKPLKKDMLFSIIEENFDPIDI